MFFFFFWKVSFIPKEGQARPRAPVLLLVWQRLRTLGTLLRIAAHITMLNSEQPANKYPVSFYGWINLFILNLFVILLMLVMFYKFLVYVGMLGSIHYFLRIKKSEHCSHFSGQNDCSDLKIRCFLSRFLFYRWCSDKGVGGWVSGNQNDVQIYKSVGINGRSLNMVFLL